MKKIVVMIAILAGSSFAFTSCKKDYTCTCTTSIGSLSNTVTHDLPNQNLKDANEACDRFEDNANDNTPGTTNCHL